VASDRQFVIVGAGQAGGWGAKTLRDTGFDGKIVMLGDERYVPHERPPLSKQVLLGEAEPEVCNLWPDDQWQTLNIEFRPMTRVAKIHRDAHEVETGRGERIKYEKLLIATGSRPRPLPSHGAELKGVFYLRYVGDAMMLRERLAPGAKVVIVGGGWIGLEVAAAAKKRGAEVTVVEFADRLCARALAPDMSEAILALHHKNGVDIRLKQSVARFEGDGEVQRAVLADGHVLECSTAVIGIGIIPNFEIAAEAGLDIDNGIVVDERGRTSDPDIYAAGDVTNHPNPLLGRRVRLESWENAQNQAIAAAKAMLGADAPAYGEIPWFWSDQYDANIQLVGLPERWDETAVRGDPASGRFVAFYLAGGKIVGAAGINTGGDVRFARRLIAAGAAATAAELSDPKVKLQSLAKR
jgi:3-phenylpropionate/trans-cinnamate dioxygenase ferredoxin reductase subunit